MATVNELIREAFKTLNLIEVNANLSAAEQNEGLFYLNEEVATLNGNGIAIPYFSEVQYNTVVGQGSYTIGPAGTNSDVTANRFVEVETVAITISDVMIPLPIDSRFEAFETGRLVQNVTPGIPSEVWVTYTNTQSVLHLYLPPDDEYEITVRGKQELSYFEANTNITSIPDYMRKYFRYALAKELSMSYPSAVWTPQLEGQYQKLLSNIKANNEIDIAIRPTCAFLGSSGSGYYLTPIFSGEN